MKKAYELSTLCDAQTCVFIASDCDPAAQFETWPPNRDQIHTMIRSYKSHSFLKQSRNSSYDLNRFLSDRKNKIVTDTAKLRHNVDKFKDHNLDSLSEDQLKDFLATLDSKIGVVDDMIQFMEADYDYLIEEVIGTPSFCPFETEESCDYNVEDFQSLLEDEFLGALVQNHPFNFDSELIA